MKLNLSSRSFIHFLFYFIVFSLLELKFFIEIIVIISVFVNVVLGRGVTNVTAAL